MNKKYYLIIGVIVIVLLAVYAFSNKNDSDQDRVTATSTENGVITIPNKVGDAIKGPGYTIEAVPLTPNYPKPAILPIVFPETLDANSRAVLEKNVNTIIGKLKADPSDYQSWLLYGLYQKTAENYKGAEATWLYATTIPHNYVVYGNLGDLYAYHLHDNKKAETNLRAAINAAKDNPTLYANMFYFYKDVLKNKMKARSVAEEGKKAVPSAASEFDELISQL